MFIISECVAFFRTRTLLDVLLVFAPFAIVLRVMDISLTFQFIFSAIAIIPLAALLGDSTESLSEKLGPGVGGLLNATFGNAAELIIGLFSTFRGLDVLVKSSLVGSILSNLCLVLGTAILLGGIRYKSQRFSEAAANVDANLCVVASIGFLVPSLFKHFNTSGDNVQAEHRLSIGISIMFLSIYVALLLFQLKTHADIFNGEGVGSDDEGKKERERESHEKNQKIKILNGNEKGKENTPLVRQISNGAADTSSPSPSATNIGFIFPRAISYVRLKPSPGTGASTPSSSYRSLDNNNNSDSDGEDKKTKSSSSSSLLSSVQVDDPSQSRDNDLSPIDDSDPTQWSMRKSLTILIITTLFVVTLSEILTGAVEVAGVSLGLNDLFMGVIVVAIVGNAAEHASAVFAALNDKMDVAISISFGSALQICLFVMPVIVLTSYLRDDQFGVLDLTLTEFEVFTVTAAALLSWMVVQDGGSNWLEGMMLIVIYAIFALAFFFSGNPEADQT